MIKIGFVGCGGMAQIHAECLDSIGRSVITAVYDSYQEAARSFTQRFGGKVCSSLDELLAMKEIDCVYICTRHDSHLEIVKRVIEADKPMFCEKPLATHLAESEEISDRVAQSGLPFMLGFNQRRSPGALRLKRELDAIDVPTVINLSVSCVNFLDEWVGKPDQGGILTSLAVHAFDLIRFITGDEVVEISCLADRLRLGPGYLEDGGVAMCRLRAGTIVSISFHDHAQESYVLEPTKAMFRLEVHTRSHSLLSHCHSDFVACCGSRREIENYEPYNVNSSWGYVETNRHFVHALERGLRPSPNEEDGIIADRLVHAARRSIQEKHMITKIPVNQGGE